MTPERLQEIRLDRDIAAARIAHGMGNGVDHSLVDLLAAYDALQADYAAAVRALRDVAYVAGPVPPSDFLAGLRSVYDKAQPVLSSPRAVQVLKEVE